MATLLNKKRIDFLMRWVLGLTFIIASFHKIESPAEFAKIIYGYDLFPHLSINVIAIFLPFLELTTGLALIFNRYSKAAAALIGIMLTGFILAISINLVRGHEFDCGCFSFGSKDTLAGTASLLIRDLFFLFLCIWILFNKMDNNRKTDKWTA